MIGKPALCCVLLGAAMTAIGCSRLENAQRCASVEPDTRIAACTALIEAGHNTAESLSAYYTNRGTAYNSHRDYARAIEDHDARADQRVAEIGEGTGAIITVEELPWPTP